MDISNVVNKKRATDTLLSDMENGISISEKLTVTDASLYYLRKNEKGEMQPQRDYRVTDYLRKYLSENWLDFMDYIRKESDAEIASMKAGIDKLYSEAFPTLL